MQRRRPDPSDFIDRSREPEKWVFRMTERDERILEHIWEHGGFLTDYQITALEFGAARNARRRLGNLFHNGYLSRLNLRGRARYGFTVYWLTGQGLEQVAQAREFHPREYPYVENLPWGSLEHDVLVNDFVIAVQQACAASEELSLYEWVNERIFRSDPDTIEYVALSGKTTKKNVIPDQFMVIDREQAGHGFRSRLLLELDNATHPNKRFADEKVLAGLAYLRSAVYERRFGKGGRWLVVTKSQTRLAYLKDITERAAGKDAGVFYFTTFEQVTSETVLTAPIWIKGGESAPVALFPAR